MTVCSKVPVCGERKTAEMASATKDGGACAVTVSKWLSAS